MKSVEDVNCSLFMLFWCLIFTWWCFQLSFYFFFFKEIAIHSLYDFFFLSFHILLLIQKRDTRLQMLLMERTLGGRVPVLRMELNTIMWQLHWIYSRYSAFLFLLFLNHFPLLKLYLGFTICLVSGSWVKGYFSYCPLLLIWGTKGPLPLGYCYLEIVDIYF